MPPTSPAVRVVVAGATGWTGQAVAAGVAGADDLELVAAVARSAAGTDLARPLGADALPVPVFGTVAEALDAGRADVLVDYTSHDAVLDHTLTALARGVRVVIGTSGLAADDFETIAAAADDAGVGVVAAGNFSVTAALAKAAALLAARYLPNREVIDYASAGKGDAPSGTAQELAEQLGEIESTQSPVSVVPVDETAGVREARGGTIAGVQVHSIRLPSFSVSTEVVFALPDERLVIRHDAGSSAQPSVGGTLLAVRAVMKTTGLVRGLDTLLLGS
jgi:4-hydroxy-tetrahydrodipicolinate reductase